MDQGGLDVKKLVLKGEGEVGRGVQKERMTSWSECSSEIGRRGGRWDHEIMGRRMRASSYAVGARSGPTFCCRERRRGGGMKMA